MIGTRDFLDAVAGYSNSATSGPQSSANRPIRLGIIDPYYTAGPARVLFDGETVISDRRYSWVGSYSPVSGERVYLMPVGQTYLIGGSLDSTVPYSVYHDLDLNTAGGFAVYDTTTFHAPSFTKTESGMVKLSGLIKHNTITGALGDFVLLAYVPEGFRPIQDMDFPVVTSGNAAGVVTVRSDGDIVTRNDCSGTFISFGNIVYPTQDIDWQTPTLLNGWELGAYSVWTKQPQYGKDTMDRVWLRGAFGESGTAKSVDTAVFTLPAGYRPSPNGHYATGASVLGSTGSFAHFFTNPTTGDFSWRTGSSNDDEVSIDGIYFADPDATWIAPTMLNSWVSYGAPQAPGYWKDSEGVVHLRGLIKSGTINANAFLLPVGYRPKKNIVRAGVSNGLANRLDVRSDGSVMAVTGSNLWVSLDGVSFTAEQ